MTIQALITYTWLSLMYFNLCSNILPFLNLFHFQVCIQFKSLPAIITLLFYFGTHFKSCCPYDHCVYCVFKLMTKSCNKRVGVKLSISHLYSTDSTCVKCWYRRDWPAGKFPPNRVQKLNRTAHNSPPKTGYFPAILMKSFPSLSVMFVWVLPVRVFVSSYL